MPAEVVSVITSGVSALLGADTPPSLVFDQAVSDQLALLVTAQTETNGLLHYEVFLLQICAFGLGMLAGLLTWALILYAKNQRSII